MVKASGRTGSVVKSTAAAKNSVSIVPLHHLPALLAQRGAP
jgi:hypothetical protein